MSLGNRLFYVAIRGCLISALLLILASGGGAQSNPTALPTQPQQQQTVPPPPSVVQQPIPKPPHYQVSCERPEDHEAADLCEQRRMSKASEDSVWWLSFQTYLGILGAVLVLCSLWFTGSAAIAATRAAKAAEAAVGVASHTAELQLRAYLSNLESRLDDFRVGSRPCGTVTMINAGQTPAHDVTVKIALALADAPNTDYEINLLGHASKAPLGPGSKIHPHAWSEGLLSKEDYAGVLAGTKELYLFGEVAYLDIFGKRRETFFRLFLERENACNSDFIWSICAEGNKAT